MYKLETHCHSNLVSRCSRLSPKELINIYKENGYNGLIITEHFLNSESCKVVLENKFLPYEEQVERFYDGYLKIKEEAKGILDVFFGFEYGYLGTDFLVYGWDKKDLLNYSKIMQMSVREFIEFVKDTGALIVHAHPYREANYIDHIRLFPGVEGVETYNSCRTDFCNALGEHYAKAYNKICLAGSDIHYIEQKKLSGMMFEEKVKDIKHFISLVRQGKGQFIYKENVLSEN